VDKLKQVVAFLFQRSGKRILRDSEIYAALSYELGWLTPAQSVDLIKNCLDKGLLKKEGDGYTPTFEYEKIEIPLGFKIDGQMVEVPAEKGKRNMISSVVSEIAVKSISKENAEKEIRRIAEKEKIIPEVAALIVARKQGIDVSRFIKEAWDVIKSM